jgi:hypothetical protein
MERKKEAAGWMKTDDEMEEWELEPKRDHLSAP